MNILAALWLASLLLAALAIAVMAALIVARLISVNRARDRERERRRHVALLLSAPRSREEIDPTEPATGLLADLTVELVRLVRGEEKGDFVASATRLGVPQALRDRLRSGRAHVRFAAAEALADFPGEATRASLEVALDDSSPDVRLTAALSMAAMDATPPVRELVDRLGIGTRENSLLCVSLLREIARRHPDDVNALVIDQEVVPAAKAAAIEALSASRDYSLVPVIARYALEAPADSNELPRYLRVLGDFGHPAGSPAIVHALSSPVAAVRAAAAEAAGRIGMVDSAERLGSMLDDADWWVRLRAGQALVRMGGRGENLLKALAEGTVGRAQETAAVILKERRAAR